MSRQSVVVALTLVVVLQCFWAAPVPAQPLPPDVGLITKLSGEVTYVNDRDQKQPAKAQAFMKVRQGDRFQVSPGGSLILVYHANGRQETWEGPAAFRAETDKSQGEGQAQPQVATLPLKVTQKMGTSPLPLPRADTPRMGGIRTMGGLVTRGGQPCEEPPALAALDPAARKELAQAAKTYQAMRNKAGRDDLTPELYYLAVLAEYRQFATMADLVAEMEKRQPQNPVVRDLKAWVQSQGKAVK